MIVAELKRDDGLDSMLEFEIDARLGGQTRRFVVAAAQFGSMQWVAEKLGARAVIAACMGVKDRVREAIQLLSSSQIVERTVYTHTGWRRLDAGWCYLHGAGAIRPDGAISEIKSSLPEVLAPYVLPPPPSGSALKSALHASLSILALAPDRGTVPVLGALWRSVLGTADFSVFLYGETGRFKTALATLLQQHFGAGFCADGLPGSWISTSNFNERLAFVVKDALLVFDDFRPAGSASPRERFHQDADRLLRGAANRVGRGRLRSDGSMLPTTPPRALILSTGEQMPEGESLRARMIMVEVGPADIDQGKLSVCQRDAANGMYARRWPPISHGGENRPVSFPA
ncbi:MAG TPA: hypothetical protein VEF07_02255 [Candidatus Binataceae bacterium]|nr:hypothetical protein [Candidatus Binataceae bacterium]